jgi:tetratricopeptide (TPR) repeat protein
MLLALGAAAMAQADVLGLLKQGMAARQHGDDDAAIYYLSAAIAAGVLRPNDLAAVLASRGVAYDNKGQTDAAIADFTAALELKPDFGDAYIDRGLSWTKKHEYDRAIAEFTQASNVDPAHAFIALNDRGNAYDEKGDFEKAIADYSGSIRLRPDYATAYYNRANSHNALEPAAAPDIEGPRARNGEGRAPRRHAVPTTD